jgi:alkanesulfonate monooxygenase
MRKPLRFHWSLSSAGEKWRGASSRAAQSGLPNLPALIEFCRHAERNRIESLLTAIGFHRPDPTVLATALSMQTTNITFMVACRPGAYSPMTFVQQVNTLSAISNGRVSINIVAGHTPAEQRSYGDFLPHDERYRRTDEFLTVCQALWNGHEPVDFEGEFYRVEGARLNTPFVSPHRSAPEIYLGGASPPAIAQAAKHASCLLTMPAPPEELAERVRPVLESGREVGLLVSILARASHEAAVGDAYEMLSAIGSRARITHEDFARRSDSVAFTSTIARAQTTQSHWVTPVLWTGAVPYLGAPAIALVGSYEEVAAAIGDYEHIGVTQFLFMGWPDMEEMTRFSTGVMPRIRIGGVSAAGS